ncbi:hypothetical protein [Mesorhizobium sp.]|uniref:hypothetical protein n=1 Tax=Mesorhizobium sp. TaxID=1871066 RepID=UPI000FE618ED|nr:hypothetical protein [Mesorhizobium sp.]RWN61239.1 MAG: hypothetical protein EOS00_11720 [Mesorhizobium sp.]
MPAKPAAVLRLRIEKRLEIGRKIATKQQRASVEPASVDRIIQRLPTMSPDQLVTIWKNAIRLIIKAGANKSPGGPNKVLSAVEAEWRKRGLRQTNPDEVFSWPSTEATGGDKSLSFAGKIGDGMLSYLEYRVGKVTVNPHQFVERSSIGSLVPSCRLFFPKTIWTSGMPRRQHLDCKRWRNRLLHSREMRNDAILSFS